MPETPAWKQKDVFPLIQNAIRLLCDRSGFATYEATIDALLEDTDARRLITKALQKRPDWDRRAMAGNMIAWMSQKDTESSLGEFSREFTKRRDEGNTYCWYPASLPSSPINRVADGSAKFQSKPGDFTVTPPKLVMIRRGRHR